MKNRRVKIRTLDINCLEWFDRINGNSYFAATIIVNYQMQTERKFILPFQYGYGDHYKHMAFKRLQTEGYIFKDAISPWRYYEEKNIIVRYSKKENCLQRELKQLS